MVPRPWIVISLLLMASLLAGCADEVNNPSEPGPAPEVVLAANILTNGPERLHIPMWPGIEPTVVAAAYRNGSVDWVYYDADADAIVILPQGLGDPAPIFDGWVLDAPGDRNIQSLSAAWLDSGEMHIYVVETVLDPGYGINKAFGFHAWLSPAGTGSEAIDPPGLPDIWDRMTTGLRSDGHEVALALGSYQLHGLLMPTGEERGVVYSTTSGAFGPATELADYNVQRAIPWQGDVVACGGRQDGGEVAIARRSTEWNWEPVATSTAAMPSCDVAGGAELKMFFYGLPLVGSGGGGQSGSEDSAEYQVAHWRNRTWEIEKLGRDPFRGQWLMSTAEEHFLVYYSRDGTHNQEILAYNGNQWSVALSASGGDPGVVTTPSNPTMLVDGARSSAWDHDGWAALELVR